MFGKRENELREKLEGKSKAMVFGKEREKRGEEFERKNYVEGKCEEIKGFRENLSNYPSKR